MAFDYDVLVEISTLDSSIQTIFTQTPDPAKSFIRTIILHNSNISSERVQIYKVPVTSGMIGSADDTNKFIDTTLEPGATMLFEFASPGIIIKNENDTIQAIATSSGTITIQVYGGVE